MKKLLNAVLMSLFLISGAIAATWTPLGNFLYKPDIPNLSVTQQNALNTGFNRVDARLAKEIWVGDPNYGATLQTAITAIGSSSVILRAPAGTCAISADLTVPANVQFEPQNGFDLQVATGITVTFNGPVADVPYKWITCAGTGRVVLGEASPTKPNRVWWEGVEKRFNELEAWDDFNRTDRTLQGDRTASGHTWYVVGHLGIPVPTAVIANGAFETADNAYAYLQSSEAVRYLAGVFSFTADNAHPNNGESIMALIACHDNNVNNILHLEFSQNYWLLTKRIAGGAFVPISAYMKHNLLVDGSQYRISMTIVGNDITIVAPDGQKFTYTDADISTIAPDTGCWQIFPQGTNPPGRWHHIQRGGVPTDTERASGGAAPISETTWLKGEAGTKRQRISFTSTTTGWYRVATNVTWVSYGVFGEAIISAQNAAQKQLWHLGVIGENFGNLWLYNLHNPGPGKPVLVGRLSRDGTGNEVALDLYIVANTEVNIDMVGYFTKVVNPVVGATALSTQNITLSSYKSIGAEAQAGVFGSGGGIGWFRVATEKTWGKIGLIGKITIIAENTSQRQIWEIAVTGSYNDATPTLVSLMSCGDSVITNARLSVDTPNSLVALDLLVGSGYSSTVTVLFSGAFTPVDAPVIGATVLPTGNTVLSFVGP